MSAFGLSFYLLLCCTSCINRIDNDEVQDVSLVDLRVQTRTATETGVPYPLTIYAFNSDGQCAATQTIGNESERLSLSLPAGSYRLLALAGTNGYTLPATFVKTSSITMTDAHGITTTALMSGNADVTLTSSEATANILLSYRVARLSMTLTDIPTDVTAVNVSFSPQYGSYTVDGNYSSAGKTATVACKKTSGSTGEWSVSEFYLFPGSSQQTVLSIALTGSNGKTDTYGYTYTSPLVAATPYALTGSYKKGLSVGGTLTAEGWKTPVTISFNFGIGGSDTPGDEGDVVSVTKIPGVATIWNGTCVVGVTDQTASGATLLVMSVSEWSDQKPTDAIASIQAYTVATLPGTWRLPTDAEVPVLRAARKSLATVTAFNNLLTGAGGNATSTGLYLCTTTNGGGFLKYTLGNETPPEALGETKVFRLRAVRQVIVRVKAL